MSNEDQDPLQSLLNLSWERLQAAQAQLEQTFGGYEIEDFDLEEGFILFSKNEHQKMKVPVYPIGSFSESHSSWMWAWANPSLPEAQKAKSEKFKDLATQTGLTHFSEEAFDADIDLIWQLTSICFASSDEVGVYHLPISDDQTLFLFIEGQNT